MCIRDRNKDAILHSFAEMNYFEQAAQKAQEDFGDYIVQSGFEEDLFEDLATPQMVEQDLSAFIDGFYAYIRGEACLLYTSSLILIGASRSSPIYA